MASLAARLRRLAEQHPLLGADAHAPARAAALRGSAEHGFFDRVARAVSRSSAGGARLRAARRREAPRRLVEVRLTPRPRRLSAFERCLAKRQKRLSDARRQLAARWPLGGGGRLTARSAPQEPQLVSAARGGRLRERTRQRHRGSLVAALARAEHRTVAGCIRARLNEGSLYLWERAGGESAL